MSLQGWILLEPRSEIITPQDLLEEASANCGYTDKHSIILPNSYLTADVTRFMLRSFGQLATTPAGSGAHLKIRFYI